MEFILYLDTNFILDMYWKRNLVTTNELKSIIKKNGIPCKTSIINYFEILSQVKDAEYIDCEIRKRADLDSILRRRKNRNLNDESLEKVKHELENFNSDYDFIEKLTLDTNQEIWMSILQICTFSNVEWADAIHLYTAFSSQATHLITNDTTFKKAAEEYLAKDPNLSLKIVNAEEMIKIFRDETEKIKSNMSKANYSLQKFIKENPSRIIGDEGAPIIMVQFVDMESPFCRQFFIQSFPKIKSDFINKGKLKYVFLNFPLENINENALNVSRSIIYAGNKGKLIEMIEKLSTTSPPFDKDTLTRLAKEIQLDPLEFSLSFEDKNVEKMLRFEQSIGAVIDIQGVPHTFIQGIPIVGNVPYSVFKKTIDSVLKTVKS